MKRRGFIAALLALPAALVAKAKGMIPWERRHEVYHSKGGAMRKNPNLGPYDIPCWWCRHPIPDGAFAHPIPIHKSIDGKIRIVGMDFLCSCCHDIHDARRTLAAHNIFLDEPELR